MTRTHQQSNDPMVSDHRLTRRELFPLVGAAAVAAALAPTSLASAQGGASATRQESEATRRFVYVGTYTKPNTAPGGVKPSEALGIYVFALDPETGGLTP